MGIGSSVRYDTWRPLQPVLGSIAVADDLLCSGKASGKLSGRSGKYWQMSPSPSSVMLFSVIISSLAQQAPQFSDTLCITCTPAISTPQHWGRPIAG